MRKTRKRTQYSHFLALAAALSILIIVCCLFLSVRSNAGSAANPETGRVKRYTSVYIREGDTLWSIAEEYMSEEYGSIDNYVSELQEMNHIGSDIHAGRYLTISYYADPER